MAVDHPEDRAEDHGSQVTKAVRMVSHGMRCSDAAPWRSRPGILAMTSPTAQASLRSPGWHRIDFR
jgi:hypothetical protein